MGFYYFTRWSISLNLHPDTILASPVDNYFQYFSEVEQCYLQRRGSPLLMSTLDWALIEMWKDAGIPLAAVLRGIDDAFDSWEKKPPRGKVKRINSLTYCTQPVMLAAQQMAEAATGASAPKDAAKAKHDSGLEAKRVHGYLVNNAAELERVEKSSVVADSVKPLLRETAKSLRELAGESGPSLQLEELERYLTVLEEKLMAALLASTSDSDLVEARAQAEREMALHKRRMQAAQIEQLYRQFVNRKLLEKAELPRLSLFYMG